MGILLCMKLWGTTPCLSYVSSRICKMWARSMLLGSHPKTLWVEIIFNSVPLKVISLMTNNIKHHFFGFFATHICLMNVCSYHLFIILLICLLTIEFWELLYNLNASFFNQVCDIHMVSPSLWISSYSSTVCWKDCHFVLNHLLYLYPKSILTMYVKSFWIWYSVLLMYV